MLFIAIEMVPDAMVVAMERCVNDGLTNVFSWTPTPTSSPSSSPRRGGPIYVNFCDPWPSKRHAKRRLTHGNFLKLYRQVLKMGGQIHFKTDNQPLFEFSVEELPQFGFELSEVTRNLHENGPVGTHGQPRREKSEGKEEDGDEGGGGGGGNREEQERRKPRRGS